MTTSTLTQLAHLVKTQVAEDRELLMIPVGAIRRDDEQPRNLPGDIKELAASIGEIGLQQPLLVREDPERAGSYVLVAGERRFLAAIEAGLTELPCLALSADLNDPARRLVVQLAENLQRSDLEMMEVARALRRLVDELEMPKGEIARLLGKPPAFVSKHLALLRATGAALEALEEQRLKSPETYRLFAKLPAKSQERLLRRTQREERSIGRPEVEQALSAAREVSDPVPSGPARPERYSLRLTSEQILRIIEALVGEAPADRRDLKATLLELL